ncbi:redoxin domain-containing protein [Zunongwangia sp.]|uniref:TlpA disulfide reductase family protein n=1 Tax=Zunongwangia sp. TaxID=1965325 RepID=UPI003AA910F5
MRQLVVPALVLCAALSSCEKQPEDQGKDIGSLHISKEFPQPGDEITITYASEDSIPSEEDEQVKGIVNFMTGTGVYPEDLDLIDSVMLYTSTLKIPDTATAISFQFKQYDIDQNNEKAGFVMPLYDKEGKTLKGSSAQIANLYSQGARYGNIEMPKDSIISHFESDFKNDPELAQKWAISYVNLIKSDKEKVNAFVEEQMAASKENDSLSEEQYLKLQQIYGDIGNKKAVDSLENMILEKFPKGNLATQSFYTKLYQAQGTDAKEKVFKEYQDKIGKANRYRDYMLSMLVTEFAKEGKIDKVQEYASKISDQGSLASIYNNIAWKLVEEDKELAAAEKLSKKSLDIVEAEKLNKPDYYTKRQYEQNLKSTQAMYADTYGLILFKQGKLKEAIAAQEIAVDVKTSTDVTDRYLQFLTADKQYDKVVEKATEYIKEGNLSDATKNYLKTAYKATAHEEDFDSYLANLEKIANDNAVTELKRKMINEEAFDFTLKDLDGSEVSLADFKGKTVILDFWATWCGPCKMSFPGMQMAVEEFKDNPDVVFLFIDTWETQAPDVRTKEVTEFINKNDYDFHVLMDEKIEDSKAFKVVGDYGVSGIPTKFVVGPDGNIKFKSVGYNGNAEKLAEEIAMMVSLSQS